MKLPGTVGFLPVFQERNSWVVHFKSHNGRKIQLRKCHNHKRVKMLITVTCWADLFSLWICVLSIYHAQELVLHSFSFTNSIVQYRSIQTFVVFWGNIKCAWYIIYLQKKSLWQYMHAYSSLHELRNRWHLLKSYLLLYLCFIDSNFTKYNDIIADQTIHARSRP